MMYEKVHFTGLTISSDEIFETRYHEGIIPSDWTKIQVEEASVAANKRWIEANLTGKFSIYRAFGATNIFFEDKTAAVLYKLLDGNKSSVDEKITQIIP
jgi:hypothetical protein